MISHKYRCIYIHIPRAGGTSIEHALCGYDWWAVSPETKHLLASQAKILYADYWDSYFKFSIVRNPYSRMVSCLKYAGHFASDLSERFSFLDFLKGYIKRFGYPVTTEFDYRFHDSVTSKNSYRNAVYLNILDEELDFVGRFESLEEDFAYIRQAIQADDLELLHHEASVHKVRPRLDSESFELLESIFRRDLEHFGYRLPGVGSG